MSPVQVRQRKIKQDAANRDIYTGREHTTPEYRAHVGKV